MDDKWEAEMAAVSAEAAQPAARENAPTGTAERLIQRLEDATPGLLFYCEADREEAVEIAQEEIAAARGVGNVMEALWRDSEAECARLASGLCPSDEAIAEAFHEHRRETNSGLPPWSEVQQGSGIWIYSHNFAARLASLPVAVPSTSTKA